MLASGWLIVLLDIPVMHFNDSLRTASHSFLYSVRLSNLDSRVAIWGELQARVPGVAVGGESYKVAAAAVRTKTNLLCRSRTPAGLRQLARSGALV